jgi:hypothetical protein
MIKLGFTLHIIVCFVFSPTKCNDEAGIIRAGMKSGLIIVCVAVGRGARSVDQVDVLGPLYDSLSTLLRRDWRSWTAKRESRLDLFVTSVTVWRWVIPLLAWSQAHCSSSVLDDSQVTDVVFPSWALVKGHITMGYNAGASLIEKTRNKKQI